MRLRLLMPSLASVHVAPPSDRWLWRSGEGATTFVKCCPTLPLTRVQALAHDRAASVLYAGTEQEGVWKSTDGGASWSAANAALRQGERAGAGDRSVRRGLRGDVKRGVFRSANRGASWTRVAGEPPHPDAMALAFDPSGPGRLYVEMGGGSVWRLDAAAADPR